MSYKVFDLVQKLTIFILFLWWVLGAVGHSADATDLIKVFFNQPELSTSTSKIANPDIGIDDALVKFVKTAKPGNRVYLCFQSSTTQKITNAFSWAASTVGLNNIFHIMDRTYGTGYGFLNNNSTNNATAPSGSLMHNKFAVIIDTTAKTGRVWTGSYNPNDFGTKQSNENAVWIESFELAEIYKDEFRHMWDGDASRFSTDKTLSTNTARSVMVGNTKIEVYFSPYEVINGISFVLRDLIKNVTHSILFNIFTFSADSNDNVKIITALKDAYDRNLEIKGVVEGTQGTSVNAAIELKNYGINVLVDGFAGINLHHKFAIIDYGTAHAKVITGSYNWTPAARDINDENFLVIHSREVAELYWQEFQKNYSLAIGATAGNVEVPAVSEVLAYPSPARFVDEVTIGYTLSPSVTEVVIKLYTLSGEKVIELIPDFYPGTYNEERWSLTNKGGDKVAPGLYIIKVEATTGDGTFFDTEKFAVIR